MTGTVSLVIYGLMMLEHGPATCGWRTALATAPT